MLIEKAAATAQHELDPVAAGDTGTKVNISDTSEKCDVIRLGTGEEESSTVGRIVDGGHLETPSGGFKAWVYVLAIFFIFTSAWGLTQTFGAFQEIFITKLLTNSSSSSLSWIGSVQVFLVITSGVLTGPLFDAGYLRPLLAIGCTFIVFGMAMLSLATTYWQVFLAQGVCVDLGSGLVYIPGPAFVSTLFPPSIRLWAMGCANSGGSIGGIIFTFMLRRLEPTIGFPWAVRAMALVVLILAVVALAIVLPHRPHIGQPRALLDIRALREPSFAMFALAQLFAYVAFYIPPFYIPTYATAALSQNQDFAFDSLVVVSVGSFLGRTVPMLAAALVVLFGWIAVRNVAGFIVFCLAYGLVSGVMVSAPSSAISHPVLAPSMSVIGARMGMLWMFGGVGVLIGSPIAGALVNVWQVDFTPAQAFTGAMVAAASLYLIAPLISMIKYDRKTKNRP